MLVPVDGYWLAHPLAAEAEACRNPSACSYAGRAGRLGHVQERMFHRGNLTELDMQEFEGAMCSKVRANREHGSGVWHSLCAGHGSRQRLACKKDAKPCVYAGSEVASAHAPMTA